MPNNILKKISPIHLCKSVRRRTRQALTDRKVAQYLEKNDLRPLIEEARAATNSIGADDSDYVLLHAFVRNRKPKYVLECGTGMTTWIIAHALQQNWEESGQAEGSKGTVVSIEEDADWHKHAVDAMADRYRSFIEFVRSDREYFHYSYLFGVSYKTIPDHPYELMFVDGPICRYFPSDSNKDEYQNTAAMDLVKLLLRRDLKITVLVDNLKRTQIAYSCLFRPGLLTYYENFSSIGVLEDIERADLVVDTTSYLATFQRIVKSAKWYLAPSFFKGS